MGSRNIITFHALPAKRWREGNQPLRWAATGLLEAEKKFRRIKGYQEMLLLKERLNPSRLQQREVRVSRSRLNVVAGRPTVANIESRCNQPRLGHPPAHHNHCHRFHIALTWSG